MRNTTVVSRLKGEVKERVKKLLQDFPAYRDSDEKLCSRYWYNEMERLGFKPQTTTSFVFLDMMGKNKLTPADLITRARRLLQSDFAELRGQKWLDRHKEAEDVSKQINQ